VEKTYTIVYVSGGSATTEHSISKVETLRAFDALVRTRACDNIYMYVDGVPRKHAYRTLSGAYVVFDHNWVGDVLHVRSYRFGKPTVACDKVYEGASKELIAGKWKQAVERARRSTT
jgi:hypothetical protein